MPKKFKLGLLRLILVLFFAPMNFAHAKEGDLIPFRLQQKESAISPTQLSVQVEEKLFELTNQQRQARGLSILAFEKTLQKAARDHSNDMLKRNYLSHFSPENRNALDRIKKHVSKIQTSIGENLHTIQSASGLKDPEAIATTMIRDWMGSPSHRKNILAKNFRFSGLGCVSDGYKIYCTQLFSGDAL